MNLKVLTLLACFACITPTASVAHLHIADADKGAVVEDAESVYTMRVRGELVFNTEGKVVEHHYTTQVEQAVAGSIDRAMKSWRFQPYLKEGAAVNVRTPFEVTLAGREVTQGQFEIKVESARFGAAALPCTGNNKCEAESEMENRPRLPGYPIGMMKTGVSGMVLVYLKLDAEGHVVDASVAQSALFNIKGNAGVLAKVRSTLERECLMYARRAKWKPGTGDSVPGTNAYRVAGLPFIFKMSDDAVNNLGEWRLEARGPKQVAAWMQSDKRSAPGVSDVDSSGLVATRSEYQLTEGQPQG